LRSAKDVPLIRVVPKSEAAAGVNEFSVKSMTKLPHDSILWKGIENNICEESAC